MAHPDSIWRDSLPNFWTRREGDMEVEILFGHEDDPYDWITQQWLVTTRLNIRQDGLPERPPQRLPREPDRALRERSTGP